MLLGAHLGYDVSIVSPEEEDAELLDRFDLTFGGEYDDEADLVSRPPVVTIMGHVDHGKTLLLDAIRKTDVVKGEAGGITQHIGAYQVHHPVEGGVRELTFIDTPGHEAFTAMRARGAKVTDIAVLVVAADDGVKPQTIEALNHAQAAEVPIVVAVNKVDKEGADPAKVRGQLTEYGLVAEEYGGTTMFVDVSAKAGTGLEELLDAILLTTDAALELLADAAVDAQGVAIEARLDKGRGPVATVLVQRGTLRVGDSIVAGDAFGRVRAMLNERGENVAEASPGQPVQVLGFTSVPGAGDNFLVVGEDRVARQIAEQRPARERNAALAQSRGRPTLESLFDRLKEGEKTQLNLILKGDVSGSVEAVEDALLKIEVDRRGLAADHPPRRRRDHRERRHAGVGLRRGHPRLQRPGRGQRPRPGRPRARGRPLLLGHLRRDRGRRGRAQGHAQARVRGGPARHRGGPRGLPRAEDRQHRRFAGPLRAHPPQHQGAPASATASSSRTTSPSSRCAASRTTRPRSARATSAVSGSASSTTSRPRTSSRRGRCGRSRGPRSASGRWWCPRRCGSFSSLYAPSGTPPPSGSSAPSLPSRVTR